MSKFDDIDFEFNVVELPPITLCDAVYINNVEKTKELIVEDKSQLNAICKYSESETPLVIAVENGNYEIVKILLDEGANPYLTVNKSAPLDYSNSPLTIAENKRQSSEKYDSRINSALLEVCKIYSQEFANETCWNLTVSSVRHSKEYCRGYIRNNIICAGADINMRSTNGTTPLLALISEYYALEDCNCEVLKYLLDNGANPNVCDNSGLTPLTKVILDAWKYRGFGLNCADVVKLLLKNGADFGYAMCADFEKSCEILQLLKENKIEQDLQGIIELLRAKHSLVVA